MRTLAHLLCSIVAVALFALPALAEPRKGQPTAVLTGEVLSAKDNAPIKGARVTLWQAFPREGPGYYCPGCYRDCGRSTLTDEKGVFTLDHLDDALMYKLLITAEGYSPLLTVKSQNPALGPKVGEKGFHLQPRDWSLYTPHQTLRGRVLETSGKPVAGATVEAWGATNKDGTGIYGSFDGIDPLAVTAADGTFKIGYTNGADFISVTVNAPGMTSAVYKDLATGDKVHDLTVTEGAAVAGRLIMDGQPMPDVEVGIFGTSRGVDDQSHEELIATDKNGRFSFAAVRPNRDYWVYTKMDSARKFSAGAMQRVHVGEDNSTQDVGDLAMKPAFRVAGHIVTANGEPLLPGRVFLNNNDAWDDQILETGPDGEFSFFGVPAGKYDISFACAGKLIVSSRNTSCAFPGAGRLTGRIDADTTGLQVLVTPPEPQQNRITQPWEKPLEGVEP